MDTDSEKKSSFLSEDENVGWEFFITVGIKGADDLRKELGLDELNFRRLGPNVNQEPKKYFLYRLLDEVQKAALKIAYWKEYLSEEDPAKLQRIDYETTVDDQQFRARKLAEVLVDAILFSTTNDQAHYADYFSLHELNEYARSQQDRYDFFGFHNKNTEWGANRFYGEIQKLEKAGLDPKSRWYIKPGQVLNKDWTKKGVPFSSFRQRYKQILTVALPSEFVVLGKSYVHAYSMSRDVHFTPHDTSAGFREDEIRLGLNRVGLLVLALIIRCQHLLGVVPEGINKRYREMHDSNTGPAGLVEELKKRPAEIGDIVWVQGDYAEVLNVTISKYGYSAYHVKYVEHSPLADVPDDWFAGFEVRLVAKKAQIEKAADAAGEEVERTSGQRGDRAELLNCAKRAVIKVSIIRQQLRQRSPQPPSTATGDSASKPNTPPKAG